MKANATAFTAGDLVRAVAFGFLVAFVVAVAFFIASSQANAAEFKWQHFGADPYAGTRAEAMRTRESAFRAMGLPAPVIAELLQATEKPGEKVRIVVGDHLDAMMSKGGVVHRNVVVAFDKPPVGGKMEFAAPAEKWQVSWGGKVYTILLPEVCQNWSLVVASPRCVELTFNAPIGGHVRWGVGSANGPLPPDECNAQREEGGWKAWWGECDVCVPALGYIRGILGNQAQVPHKYLYPVTFARQTLRFSTEVWSKVVYICLEDANGRQSCGVYMRPQDWRGRYQVEIPDVLWVWNECPS